MKKQAIMVIFIGAVVLSAIAGCGSKEEIVTIHSSGVQAKLFTPAFSGIMSAAGGGWWTVDATPAVLAALEAGHGYAQYRLYFQNDISNSGNHTVSMDSGDSAADRPELSVTCR